MNELKVISNASPLIYLAKLGKIQLLKELFDEVSIPDEVYQEVVVRGKDEGYSDSFVVERGVDEGWIKSEKRETDDELTEFAPEVDKGEIEAINLARKYEDTLLLIDDGAGRKVATTLGFEVKGTLYVLLRGYKEDKLSKEETKELIDDVITKGFRLSPEVYSRILKELE